MRWSSTLAAIAVASGAAAQPPQQPPPAQLVITGARIHPAPGQPAIARGTIVVRDGKIAEVLTDASAPAPAADRVIDAAGKTVTAGLWNCHVHFTEPKWAKRRRAARGRLDTAAPGHGDEPRLHLGGRHRIGPRQHLRAAPSHRGRRARAADLHGRRRFVGENGSPAYLDVKLPEVTDPAQATKLTKEVLAQGVDAIKIFTGSYVGPGPAMHMLLPVVKAVTAEAHAQKKWVVAHPQTLEGTQLAVDGGVDVLAHTAPAGGAWPKETIEQMVARR